MELAYPSHVTKSKTHLSIFLSHSGQTDGTRLRTKKGAHKMTKVKNTTPNTFVAFCSSRMILPCLEEVLDKTLELRECGGLTSIFFVPPGLELYLSIIRGFEIILTL